MHHNSYNHTNTTIIFLQIQLSPYHTKNNTMHMTQLCRTLKADLAVDKFIDLSSVMRSM